MADELKLKIVLDDGSVKEGFLSIEKQASSTGKKIGNSFDKKGVGVQSLADGVEAASGGFANLATSAARAAGPYGALALAAAAAGAAIFKMALAGEQVNAVNAQFENLARSSGLQVDKFKESIIASTQGLIDDEDALQIASKGIVALGENAAKLPQILDASRSVSRALGKDFKDSFADLSQFVETGNARILKNYGIVLDLDEAYKKAAQSIGLTAAQLNEQQKQTVRTNLLLDEVPKKFSAAAESVTPLKDAFDRLKVSAGNAFEAIQTNIAESLTRSLIDKADLSNVSLGRLRKQSEEVGNEISRLNERINEIKLDKLGSRSVGATAEVRSLEQSIKALRIEQEKLFLQQSGKSDQELFSALDASNVPTEQPEKLKLSDDQRLLLIEQRKKAELELTQFVFNQEQARTQSAIQQNAILLSSDIDARSKLEIVDQNFDLTQKLSKEQLSKDIATIKDKYKDNPQAQAVVFAEIEQLNLTHKQNLLLQEQQYQQQRNAYEEQGYADSLTSFAAVGNGFSNIAEGVREATTKFSQTTVANFKQVGAQAFATFSQGVGSAFTKFGAALKSGENASQAFAQAVGDSILQIASQFGDLFIQTGIGKLALSYGTDATGYALLAAGAALKIIAGAAGAKSSPSSASADAGGGIASSPSSITDNQPSQNLERQQPGTAVSVVIQGDVLDSDESGSRIVNLINSAFDKKGVIITQGAFA